MIELGKTFNDTVAENPSISGNSGGGDGQSYPNHGDPNLPNTCALNYDVLPCDYVMKVARRDHFQALLATISSRIGSSIANQRATSHYDGSSILKGSSSSQDPKSGNYTASVTVAPGTEVLDIETVGSNMSWLEMRPTYQLRFLPQNSLTNKDDLKELLSRFYKKYQKDFARCIWKVFSTDKDGNPSNIAAIMPRQTLRNAPTDRIVLGRTRSELNAKGLFDNQPTGLIYLASDLQTTMMDNGRQVSIQEAYLRVYIHEVSNYLSWLYTGDARSFGTIGGIEGNTVEFGVHSIDRDSDTGARMEKCIWGNVNY